MNEVGYVDYPVEKRAQEIAHALNTFAIPKDSLSAAALRFLADFVISE